MGQANTRWEEKEQQVHDLNTKNQQLEQQVSKLSQESTSRKRKIDELTVEVERAAKRAKFEKPAATTSNNTTENKQMVICFTGFRHTDASTIFVKKMQQELTQRFKTSPLAKQAQIVTLSNDDFIPTRVTHLIAPPGCKTLKVLFTIIRHCWIVSPAWLVDSLDAGKFAAEQTYGFRRMENPFQHKTIHFTNDNIDEGRSKYYKLASNMVKRAEGAVEVTQAKDAMVIVTSDVNAATELAKQNEHAVIMTWNALLEVLYPKYDEMMMKRSCAKLESKK